jgi:hypothetical protein
MPVATTESVKLPPLGTFVSDRGWVVIVGATTPEPLLLEELEPDEDELLPEPEDDDELEEPPELDEEELELLTAGVATLMEVALFETLPATS